MQQISPARSRIVLTLLTLSALLASVTHRADAQSLLWKLEGKDLPAPSYLYGTIHAICPADMVIADTLVAAVGEAKQVVLELDLDDPRLLVEMGHVSFMPGDSTLEDLFAPEDFAYLERWFADTVGMQIRPMNNIRPLFLFGLLIGKVLGCAPKSYEEVFMAMARQQGKEVLGLETPAEQLEAFSAIPLREQGEMVLRMLHNMDSTRASFALLRDSYLTADVDELYRFMLDSGVEYGRYDAALLTDRNRKWIPRILEIAKDTPSFFALGAGHFGGETGILSLLRARGYRLTPIR